MQRSCSHCQPRRQITKPLECPKWVAEQYDLNETQVRKYFDRYNRRTLIAVGPHSALMPNQFGGVDEEWFLMWYDQRGRFVVKTPNLIPHHLQLIGRCVPQKFCRSPHPTFSKKVVSKRGSRGGMPPHPSWLVTNFPFNDYSITKYKHRHYGIIYSIVPKRIADSGTVWYDSHGRFLYRSPVFGWEKISPQQRCADQQWNRSVTFIDRCG